MKTIEGRSGNLVAIMPGRSETWVTKPLLGARTVVLSSSYCALSSCAFRSSLRATTMSSSRWVLKLRLISSVIRARSAWAAISCALRDFTRYSKGAGSMRNSTSPFSRGWLVFTDTSITWPLTTGITGTDTK
ncbi:hypothetical protein D3C84_804990 [compost metagenome]